MRIKGNLLIGRRPRSAQPVALGVWLLAASIGVAAALLLLDAAELRERRPSLDARLLWLQEQDRHAARESMLPSRLELEAMRRRVQVLNALTVVRGLDISELLVWLERQMPDDVRLVSLHYKAREGETRLVAEAAGTEPLTRLLRQLEKESRFSEVLLAKQGMRNVRGRVGAIQFEIQIRHKT